MELDASDPLAPYLIGSYPVPGYARSAAVSGPLAYVTDDDLHVVRLNPRLRDPAAPEPGRLEVTVPAGFTPGPYHVVLTRRDGSTTRLPNGFRVCRRRPFEARLEPVFAGMDPRVVLPPLWRLTLEGDDLFFEPEPRHEALLLLPTLPAALETELVPGGPGERAIELELLPGAGLGRVRLIAEDPEALVPVWEQALEAGGLALPSRDAHSYGDVGLRVAPLGDAAPGTRPAGGVPGEVGDWKGSQRFRYELAGPLLVAAQAEGTGVDLVLEAAARDEESCTFRSAVSSLEARDTLCDEAQGLLPGLVLSCAE
jgi:hypothetical protein